jgi:hypothetical protein
MTAAQLASSTLELIKTYTFSRNPKLERVQGGYEVSFCVNTTSTRSSSIVTRLKLIMGEAAPSDRGIVVRKALDQGGYPKDRSELANWSICIVIPVKERRKA